MKNIMYFSRTMGIGGAENVVMQLCKTQKDNFGKIIVCSSGGERVSELQNMGIKHYYIHDIDSKNPFYMLINLFKLWYVIVHEKIDIIHTHHRMAAFYIKLLSYVHHFKNIYTAHNVFTNKKKLTYFSINNIPIIAVGQSVKNNLIEYFGINEKNIEIIYNTTLDDDREITIEPLMKEIKDNNGIIISNIGRLSEQKGQIYFIEAAKNVITQYNNVYFFIIGSGEDEEKLKEKIKDLNLEDKVFMLGYRKDVKSLMKQSDIICLSSLWEGLPLVPIEAISLGKIVVATDVGGTCEIIQDGFNGYICQKGNSKDLSNKLVKSILEKDSWPKLSMNAKFYYTNMFSINNFMKKHIDKYKSLFIKQ